MNIAELTALAVKMAVNEKKCIDAIDIDRLQVELAEKRIMIGFFNNFDIHSNSALIPAIQYFSAKGFSTIMILNRMTQLMNTRQLRG